MYTINEIVYSDEQNPVLEIVTAKVVEETKLLLTFSTGERKVFDKRFLEGQVFRKLDDKDVFLDFCLDRGIITWLDGKIDCAPEFMYEHGVIVE